MIKIPYASNLYKPLSELVNYVRKRYDIMEVFRNMMQPASGLELALAGVPNNSMISPYAPPIQYGTYGGMLLASTNGGPSTKKRIKRIGWDGPKKVAIDTTGGRVLIRPFNGRGKIRDYITGILDEKGVGYSGEEVGEIVRKLQNPE